MTHVLGADRTATLSYGVYNRDLEFGNRTAGGTDFAMRATGLVWGDAGRYLHVGAAFRHQGAADTLRYRARPGSNVADNFVDTGDFAATGANHFAAEALLALGPVSVLAEYIRADIAAPAAGNPRFHGAYVLAGWFPTGDNRIYDRNIGFARRVVPAGRWGAAQLVARFAGVDLDDAAIAGGSFDRVDLGVNWWASRQWKLGVGRGRAWLNRFGTRGVTDSTLLRLQWIY